MAGRIHRGEDELFYVLKGEFRFKMGNRVVSGPVGTFVFLPRGHGHTLSTPAWLAVGLVLWLDLCARANQTHSLT